MDRKGTQQAATMVATNKRPAAATAAQTAIRKLLQERKNMPKAQAKNVAKKPATKKPAGEPKAKAKSKPVKDEESEYIAADDEYISATSGDAIVSSEDDQLDENLPGEPLPCQLCGRVFAHRDLIFTSYGEHLCQVVCNSCFGGGGSDSN